MDLKDWRKSQGLTQEGMAGKLRVNAKTYGAYETGRIGIPADVQGKIKKAGYTGLWPSETEKALGDYINREEFDSLRDDLEDACEVIRFLLSSMPEGSRPAVLPKRFR